MEEKINLNPTLPESGYWRLEDLINYLELSNHNNVEKRLEEKGIKILSFGNRKKYKMICLSDLKKCFN